MNKWIFLLIFLLFTTVVYADFNSPFTDFAPNRANQIFTDTTNFDGILDASDTTVQSALETLDDLTQSGVPCVIAADDWCFAFANNQLILYVEGVSQAKWPQTSTASTDVVLLETGDGLLLETGDGMLIE